MVLVAAIFFWPGIPMYDTVSQYDQVLGNDVTDWHPPIVVRLWQLLHPLANGTAPMFALKVGLYALGLGLIIACSFVPIDRAPRCGRARVAFSPLLLGWQMVVLKDTQMQAALIAAFGLVAWFRLVGRKVPLWLAAAAGVLLLYATLARANAVFVTAPLGILLIQRHPKLGVSILGSAATIAVVLGLSPLVNHRLFGATDSGVARSQALFDLAAIAVNTPPGTPSLFSPAERRQLVERHCVKAFFWDPLGDPSACGPITDPLGEVPEQDLYIGLARAVAAHPIAYAEHRVMHWDSTERWLVSPNLTDAGPPDEAEPNDLGLQSPRSPVMPAWQSVASVEAATPLGWPIVWTVLGLILLWPAWRRRSEPAGSLAIALLASALTLEASFLVISIASDVRYHLWPMLAVPLAAILLADRRLRTGPTVLGASLLMLVIACGVFSRATLPRAPDNYQAMIHWAYG